MFYVDHSLGATMAVVVMWSLFVPMACGASYGIAPFITRRGLGVATGLIGAGGNAGSAVTQALFFTGANMTVAEGFLWMGVMILAVTATLGLLHFPMWGGMFTRGNPDITEEEYYRCVLHCTALCLLGCAARFVVVLSCQQPEYQQHTLQLRSSVLRATAAPTPPAPPSFGEFPDSLPALSSAPCLLQP
jgi:uncharacterized membrane protein